MMLSPHLSEVEFLTTQYRQFVATQKAIWDTTPSLQEEGKRFANTTFEEVRAAIGCPLHVNSGYRCPLLNSAIQGASPVSYHMSALAADIDPIGVELEEAMRRIAQGVNDRKIVSLDKSIIECGTWIHIQAAKPGATPRLLALRTDDGVHFTQYQA